MLGGALFLLGGLWWWMSNRPIENPNDRIEFAEQIALAEDLKKRAEQTDASILAEAKQTSDEVDKWQRELINARESRKPLQEEYAQQRLNQALPSHEIASQVAAAWKQHRQRATWTNEASSQLAKAKALSENGNIADAIVALKRADAQFWFPIRWQKNAHQAFELVRSVRTDVSGRIEKSASHPGTPFAFPKRLLEELPKKLNDDDGIAGLEDVRQAEQALPEIDRLLELRGQVTQAANLSDEISQIEEARSEVVAVEKVVHQGDDELAAGQFSKAENSYQSAIEQYAILPITAIRALLASAEVNTAANKADRRLRFIDAVFRIKAGSSNVRPLYAQAYRLRAETLLVQGKADGALEACNSAIEQDQLQSTSFLLRAAIEIQRGDFQRAVADCDAALQLEQNSVTGLIRRGIARLKMNKHEVAKGESEKALADFTQALQLAPKNLVALSSRAAIWLEKGEAMRAIDDCSAALMLAPTSLSLLRLRATAYLQAKNFEPSLADWNAVLASDPKSHEALLGRGNTWLEMGEHNKAIEDFTSVIRQDTKNAAAFEARAKAWFKKGDQEKANSDYNSALRLTKEAPKSKPE